LSSLSLLIKLLHERRGVGDGRRVEPDLDQRREEPTSAVRELSPSSHSGYGRWFRRSRAPPRVGGMTGLAPVVAPEQLLGEGPPAVRAVPHGVEANCNGRRTARPLGS
jgi:hypothetical protein